jgi:hypothetical protein
MDAYMVKVSYNRGLGPVSQFFNVTAESESKAKVEAKKKLNNNGIFGSMKFECWIKALDYAENLPF